jgi:glycosyltransferase involved in cell wall biosynthesis
LVPPTIKDLSEGLHAFLKDLDGIKISGRRNREYASHFSWESAARAFERVLKFAASHDIPERSHCAMKEGQ